MSGLIVLAMMVISASGLSSAQDNATVGVFYRGGSIPVPIGSSFLLSCETRYDFLQCNPLHAAWHKHDPQPHELNDTRRFFTTVNETEHGKNWRRRQVVTEILEVQAQDAGRYQCRAQCSQETEMGHFITLLVQG